MNVTTITMDPEKAAAKIAAWMQEKHADQAVVKAQCLKGYEALAEGKKLIQLDAAIRGGGFFESGFPKLAIARADRDRVYFEWSANRTEARYDAHHNMPYSSRGRRSPTLERTIDMQRLHEQWHTVGGERRWQITLQGVAQVPLLPADCRPHAGQLRDWFILWEVEKWVAIGKEPQPDRDPLLLERVAGQLYAVLAEWELTELERAVMAGALSPETNG
jgi:hypothetical protein